MAIKKILNGTLDELVGIEGETLSEKYDKLREKKAEMLYKQNSQGLFSACLIAEMLFRKY